MIVLSRKLNESIVIDDKIVVTIVDIRGDKTRIGINVPREMPVHRLEVHEAIQREQAFARQSAPEAGGLRPSAPEPGALASSGAAREQPAPAVAAAPAVAKPPGRFALDKTTAAAAVAALRVLAQVIEGENSPLPKPTSDVSARSIELLETLWTVIKPADRAAEHSGSVRAQDLGSSDLDVWLL